MGSVNLRYLDKDKSYYEGLADTGVVGLVFIKRSGDIRVMVCTRSKAILELCNCISKSASNRVTNNLSVVDIILDRSSYVSMDRVLMCEYLGYSDIMNKGEDIIYKLDEKLNRLYKGIDVNDIIVANL